VVAAAPARAATVDLRVEGAGEEAPIFAGAVATLPHAVDGGDGTGPHPCSGPAGAAPSATATGALDDALRAAGIPWRGNWDPSFRDFFVDRIGPHTSAAPDSYWSLTVNGQFAGGGCLTRVEDGDSVRFFYGPLFEAGAPGDPGAGAGTTGQSAGGGAGPGSPAAPPRRVRGVARRGAAYLRRNPDGAGAAWSRLALALRSGRETGAAAALLPPGRIERLAGGDFGGDVNATATAVLALADQRPRAARRAGRWLLSVQDPGGGFGFRPGLAPDVDTTGLASWALARLGLREPARRGCDFVRSAQNADGGFPALPGGASNAQSTGLGLVALRICGLGPRGRAAGGASPLDYLASLARPDGSIAYAGSAAPTPVWTTAQAMLGLTGREKLAGMDTLR
jgi:hypothetical protein